MPFKLHVVYSCDMDTDSIIIEFVSRFDDELEEYLCSWGTIRDGSYKLYRILPQWSGIQCFEFETESELIDYEYMLNELCASEKKIK